MENTIKMLIAEDSAEFADVGTTVYAEFGVSPSFCEKDGTALLEEIHKQSPDVVVMDMFMKNIDAVGVMKNARRNSKGKEIIYITLSNFDSSMLEREALGAGAAYYVIKPFKTADLLERISDFIRGNSSRTSGAIKSSDSELQIQVTEILHQIGVPAHIKGYQYLRDSIIMSIEHPEIINAVTKQLYPSVAKKYETTSSRVERAIRHAIEVAWDRGDVDVLNSYYGYTIHNGRGKPTNSEFVAMISDRLRLHMKQVPNRGDVA